MNDNALWQVTLSDGQHSLVFYALAVAGLALAAFAVRQLTTLHEVSVRYRPAVIAGMCVAIVAFLSYIVLVLKFDSGYEQTAQGWAATSDAVLSWAPRYFDWTVTVPLLVVELVAVSSVVGNRAARYRTLGIALAIGMIVTGFIGGIAVDDGTNVTALWVWGAISGLCMVGLYVMFVFLLMHARRDLAGSSALPVFTLAVGLLVVVWFAYPIVFAFQGFTVTAGTYTTAQVLLSVADIIAKIGFGALIHKVAKLRTAEDIAGGIDTGHTGPVWINGEQVTGTTAGRRRR
ncbi:bacteriorhodopsin [Microbacterium enclense]|uniref:bacteriorhodopsin n=1 Tax=Microbacterium enclense TaxID=993073 RepID=UPI0036D9B780